MKKTKWLLFGIILLTTSLMQAVIYKITNLSKDYIVVALIGTLPVVGYQIETNTTGEFQTYSSIFFLLIWDKFDIIYKLTNSLLSQEKKETVNIFIRTSDTIGLAPICIIQHKKKSEYLRAELMTPLKDIFKTTLEKEEGAR